VLASLFSEVLIRDEWLRLMDNVFSNHPSFLLMCVVAYCVIGRTALLRCTERDDFEVGLYLVTVAEITAQRSEDWLFASMVSHTIVTDSTLWQ